MNTFSLKFTFCCLLLIAFECNASNKKDPDLSSEIFEDDIDVSEKAEKIADASAKYKGSLRYWGSCVDDHNPNGSLRTVNKIFKKLGFSAVNGSKGDDWDVLWSVDYPYKTSRDHHELLKSLKDYEPRIEQKINHFPGIRYITDKRLFAKHTKSTFLLPTFIFPEHKNNFTEFVKREPDVKFIEKNLKNGGVRMIEAREVDVKNDKKIYQAFMDSPFLIDDHAFDLGVFVVITSVNPLRVYRYNHDVLMRFCQKEFYPFDRFDTARYVVDDNHISAFEMATFKELHMKYGYSTKQIFDNIINDSSFSAEKFWKNVDQAINQVIPQHETRIIEKLTENKINSTINFFELLRFDFIVDDKLNPYIVEVNLSPELTPPDERFEHNSLIFEQLVYETLKLVGVGSYDDFSSRFTDVTIISNFMNIATNYEKCIEKDCADDCENPACSICLPCTDAETRFHMHEAYREHMRRGNFKRIFPTTVHYDLKKLRDSLYSRNEIMFKWFKAQCKFDKSYC